MEILNSPTISNIDDFSQFFRTKYKPYCKIAYKYISEIEVCEDIVQELFIEFWEKREKLKIKDSIDAYFTNSIRNKSVDYLRNKVKLVYETENFKIETLDILDYHEVDTTDICTHVNNAIDNLPEKCKIIFRLSREGNLSYNEISETLSISRKTVENQINIALKKIRLHLITSEVIKVSILIIIIN